MTQYSAKKVFEGYGIGTIKVINDDTNENNHQFESVAAEVERFKAARTKVVANLDKLYDETLVKAGREKAELFKAHKLMAEDIDFEDAVISNIGFNKTAEQAIEMAGKDLAAMLSNLEDDYMRARAVDVKEVATSIIDVLSNKKAVVLDKPCILVCLDMPANLLMSLDREKILGLVMTKGNVNSHTSILARTLEIPTICAIKELFDLNPLDGKKIIVDACNGEMILDPDFRIVESFKAKAKAYNEEIEQLKLFVGKPSLSRNGRKFKIYANITNSAEADKALKNDAEGIGLFRSEFIYLKVKDYPTEDYQFEQYKKVLLDMKDKEVIIRTMDIGADKKVDYFNLQPEENPALGYRSIRICRDRPEMFKTQLRALYRASVYGTLSIMIPMITSVDEIVFTKNIIKQIKKELKAEHIPFSSNVKLGIMVETPAAAVISDELAKHVDFFSIGTNDLIQYTLACDRLNTTLTSVFNPQHKAVLRLIKTTVENAHKNGIICGMCGELARDPKILPFLAAIGLDEMSCSSAYILKVRKLLSEIDTTKVNVKDYI